MVANHANKTEVKLGYRFLSAVRRRQECIGRENYDGRSKSLIIIC